VRRMGTADLLARARAGDGEAFGELTEPHRWGLQVHCYRMLGSFQDAQDVIQETMLAAWQGIGGFAEERASLRTWLYKIATNRCLNARRAWSRRPCWTPPSNRSTAPSPDSWPDTGADPRGARARLAPVHHLVPLPFPEPVRCPPRRHRELRPGAGSQGPRPGDCDSAAMHHRRVL
jgi:DNA-directed RNA polymerase specialized sigma24 family protein